MLARKRKNFKILLLNLGYCTGINGFFWQYLSKFHRYIFLPRMVEARTLQRLKNIIDRENPDMICLVEIKKGRQISSLIGKEYSFFDVKTKYGEKSLLRKTPFFYNKGNAIIAKSDFYFRVHYLNSGTKRLVYEIILPENISLLVAHLSLRKNTRSRQLQLLTELPTENKRKIICGDFNILSGLDELQKVTKNGNLKIVSPRPTFPAHKPKKFLDLFLCSSDIDAEAKVLHEQISDHLPVVLEIQEN